MGGLRFGASLGAAAGKALQDALNILAGTVNDPALKVTADGIIGPGTTRAYNRAAKHLSTGPKDLRTGSLTVAQVRTNAVKLAEMIHEEVRLRSNNGKAATKTPTPKTAAARTLQKALRALGAQRNDATLKVAVDGIIGPATTKALNRALTRYVKDAPAQYRTGKLSTGAARDKAAILATLIEREIERYKGASVSTKPAPPPTPTRVSAAQVRELQSALRSLSAVVKDASLKIAADGVVGPRTAKAVNRFLSKYASNRDGLKPPISVSAVKGAVPRLTQLVVTETNRLATAAARAPSAAPKPSTQSTPAPSSAASRAIAPTPAAPQAPPLPSAPTPSTDAAAATTPRVAVARLQKALAELGRLTKDAALLVPASGVVDAATSRAVNKAFIAYAQGAPASLKQMLSAAQIGVLAEEITQALNSEISRRMAQQAEQEARREREDAAPLPPPAAMPEFDDLEPSIAPAPARPQATSIPETELPDLPEIDDEEDVVDRDDKKFPWTMVAVGVGALAVGGLAVMAFSGSKRKQRQMAGYLEDNRY